MRTARAHLVLIVVAAVLARAFLRSRRFFQRTRIRLRTRTCLLLERAICVAL